MADIQFFFDGAVSENRPSLNVDIESNAPSSKPQYARHRHCRKENHATEQTRECVGEYAGGWCCDDCGRQFRPAERMLREHCAACSTDRCAPCMNQHVEADAAAPAAAGAD